MSLYHIFDKISTDFANLSVDRMIFLNVQNPPNSRGVGKLCEDLRGVLSIVQQKVTKRSRIEVKVSKSSAHAPLDRLKYVSY